MRDEDWFGARHKAWVYIKRPVEASWRAAGNLQLMVKETGLCGGDLLLQALGMGYRFYGEGRIECPRYWKLMIGVRKVLEYSTAY